MPNVEFRTGDMMLMKQYFTATAFALSAKEEMTVWATHVPELASSTATVMHGLLALSALHLAIFNPSDRASYIRAADRQ